MYVGYYLFCCCRLSVRNSACTLWFWLVPEEYFDRLMARYFIFNRLLDLVLLIEPNTYLLFFIGIWSTQYFLLFLLTIFRPVLEQLSISLLLCYFTTSSSDSFHIIHLLWCLVSFQNWIFFHQKEVKNLIFLSKIKGHLIFHGFCWQIDYSEFDSCQKDPLIFQEICLRGPVFVQFFIFCFGVD